MNRIKWKVMKCFQLLPSSKEVRRMNDIQWLWCYFNILKDEDDDEKRWKERITYAGFLNNPEFTSEYIKTDATFQHNSNSNSNIDYTENGQMQYNNTDFEEELTRALNNEQFIEMPEEGAVRGDPIISSDDFINMVTQNIDKYADLQQQDYLMKHAQANGINMNDLDIIQVEDDDDEIDEIEADENN